MSRRTSDAGTPKFKPGTSPPPWPMPPALAKEASAAGKSVTPEHERPPSAAALRPAPSSPRAVSAGTPPDAKAGDRAADTRAAAGTVKAAVSPRASAAGGGAPPPAPAPPHPRPAPPPVVVRTAAAPGSSLLRPPSMGSLGPADVHDGPSASALAAAAAPGPSAAAPPQQRRWGGLLGLGDVAHHVRLRKRLPLGPRGLCGELGLDTDLKTGATLRTAAVTYEATKGSTPLAALRVSPGGVHACRVFTLTLPFTGGRVAVRARGMAGLGWNRKPEFSFDVDDVKPVPLVAAAAGAALASGKCLSVARPLATAVVRLPSLYDAWAIRADGRFAAQRTDGGKGNGVAVDVKEVSFFLDV